MSRVLPTVIASLVLLLLVDVSEEASQVSRRFMWDMMTLMFDPQHRCLECYNCNCHWKSHITECSGWSPDCVFIVDDQDCSVPYHTDGGWSAWSSWSKCSGSCSSGSSLFGRQQRSRQCNSPVPHNCGKDCNGTHTDSRSCDPCNPITTTMPVFTQASKATATTPHTQPPMMPTICNKYCATGTVANNNTYTHPDASMCHDGTHSGPEAMPLVCCIVPPVHIWKQGINVMSNCNSIPPFTPIAMYTFGHYVSGTSGIFTECLQSGAGFKMAEQTCGNPPSVKHVIKTPIVDNHPNAYYTIQ